ncbi:hypothetical protein [Mesorhizobium sp. WSM4904]|uniref:phosphorylase family protein n=1 Tax=Mesorhizobium sp. WSM4904 TaxID=3038545 RepID=UPI002418488D|nr:hypothetical protein [Mesorhizobium sp. WSM4904]WFP65114.1 hypothetical protein QAZ47_11565 [Mesorhizobium sp. WSM4904]
MKILIVDDNPRKYEKLFPPVIDVGVDRGSIDIVTSASDGINRLKLTTYDLLIIDILLPFFPEQEASIDNSIQLLMEIGDSEEIQRPKRIVGISADREAAEGASDIFRKNMWTIIDYDETTDEWYTQIVNCVRYMIAQSKNRATADSRIDVAIICALAEPELSEVLRLPWSFVAAEPIDEVTFGHRGRFEVGGVSHSVMAFGIGRMGMVPTALTAARVIDRMRPKVLVMAGICAGIKGKVNLGDVVLADPSWDWQCGKYITDKNTTQFLGAAYQHVPPSIVRAHVEQLKADRASLAKISLEAPDQKLGLFKVAIGPMASGAAVIADEEVTAEIKAQHRETCAIDMESYAIYSAAYQADRPAPVAFVLKGVCDYADPHKNDGHQRDAAFASANVIRLLLERYGDRIIQGSAS